MNHIITDEDQKQFEKEGVYSEKVFASSTMPTYKEIVIHTDAFACKVTFHVGDKGGGVIYPTLPEAIEAYNNF